MHGHGLLKLAAGLVQTPQPQGSSVGAPQDLDGRTWGTGASRDATEIRLCGLLSKEFGRPERFSSIVSPHG